MQMAEVSEIQRVATLLEWPSRVFMLNWLEFPNDKPITVNTLDPVEGMLLARIELALFTSTDNKVEIVFNVIEEVNATLKLPDAPDRTKPRVQTSDTQMVDSNAVNPTRPPKVEENDPIEAA